MAQRFAAPDSRPQCWSQKVTGAAGYGHFVSALEMTMIPGGAIDQLKPASPAQSMHSIAKRHDMGYRDMALMSAKASSVAAYLPPCSGAAPLASSRFFALDASFTTARMEAVMGGFNGTVRFL